MHDLSGAKTGRKCFIITWSSPQSRRGASQRMKFISCIDEAEATKRFEVKKRHDLMFPNDAKILSIIEVPF